MLLKLEKYLNFDEYTYPVCVPPSTFNIESKAVCLISGWGKTQGGVDDSNLQYATVPILSNDQCPNNKGTICAAYAQGGIDTCHVSYCLKIYLHYYQGRFRITADLFRRK